MVRKLGNFDDWIDYFRYWQDSIGLEEEQLRSFAFAEIVDNWLDFFTYTQFIDRDGKFQLKMLSVSAFDPLSRSMGPMLKEESYHLGTGNNGLLRIVKAGKMPPEVIQRFFYKWIPTAFDLFGTDNSSSAHWAYVWGLKRRYDERENPQQEPDKSKLNELSRGLYRQEIVKLVDRLNMFIPERERQLKVPDLRFNRRIGQYAHQQYTVDGDPISADRYKEYLTGVLPRPEDIQLVHDIEKEPDWIEPKKADSLEK